MYYILKSRKLALTNSNIKNQKEKLDYGKELC